MARYIKVNPKVASFLNLQDKRNTVKDGNYLLWQADILPFGPLTQLPATLAQIGGIALLPHEARQEQDGTNIRPLPVATDERFIVEAEAGNEEEVENEAETATDEESTGNETETTVESEEEVKDEAATDAENGAEANADMSNQTTEE